MARLETRWRLKPGDVLFNDGEEPQGVYVLESGVVDLLFSARSGSAKPLRVAQAGQVLGLSSVVSNGRHDCTAIARTSCRVGFIKRADFFRLLDETPSVWPFVLRSLSSDVNAVYRDMRGMTAR